MNSNSNEDETIWCEVCKADVPIGECESTYCGSFHSICGELASHLQECEVCRDHGHW